MASSIWDKDWARLACGGHTILELRRSHVEETDTASITNGGELEAWLKQGDSVMLYGTTGNLLC